MNLNEELKAYVDGQLSASERLEVEKAAASSEEIRAEIAALQALKEEFAPLSATPDPTGKSAALAALRANRLVKPIGFRFGRWIAIGATALLVIAVVPEVLPVFSQSHAASSADVAKYEQSADSGTVMPMSPENDPTLQTPQDKSVASAASPADTDSESLRPTGGSSAANDRSQLRANPSKSEAYGLDQAGSVLNGETKSEATRTAKPSIPIVPRQYNRDIIYNGALSVAVPDVQKAVVEASSLITGLGGFIVSSQTNFEGGTGSAQLEIRVPAAKFDTANKSLAKYGRVISQNSSGQDVTADIARGEGRSRSLAVAEQEYIRMLNNARNTSSRLEIRRRLDEVRAEREGIKAETNRLKNLSAMSSLSLSFSEEESVKPDEPAENWWNDSNTGAANVLGFIGRILGRVAIYLVYLSPVWLAGLVGWMVWRKKQA